MRRPISRSWDEYEAAAEDGAAVLSAAVPQPEGFVFLVQEIVADDYRGTAVTFRRQFRTPEGAGLAGLFLRVMKPRDLHGPGLVVDVIGIGGADPQPAQSPGPEAERAQPDRAASLVLRARPRTGPGRTGPAPEVAGSWRRAALSRPCGALITSAKLGGSPGAAGHMPHGSRHDWCTRRSQAATYSHAPWRLIVQPASSWSPRCLRVSSRAVASTRSMIACRACGLSSRIARSWALLMRASRTRASSSTCSCSRPACSS